MNANSRIEKAETRKSPAPADGREVPAFVGARMRRLVLAALALAAIAFGVNAAAQAATVLYSFCSATNCTDGGLPTDDLVYAGGALYGTAQAGGAYNSAGTVFSLVPCGVPPCAETVLHNFGAGTDGVEPVAGLVKSGNWLYGTTLCGGASASTYCNSPGGGTVFKLRTNGTGYQMLHSFGVGADGAYVGAGLIDDGGVLYGTTVCGGASSASIYCSNGAGTVFSLVPCNTAPCADTVLYSFCSSSSCVDGAAPTSRLVDVGGVLYGTTYSGGAYGDGTVFSVTPCSFPPCPEQVLYSFGAGADGQYPYAGLTYVVIGATGYLFGTTTAGGANGLGTVFAIVPCGSPPCTETWLYSFAGGAADGIAPYGDLVKKGAYLYGTTIGGGASGGWGTVFKVKANGLSPETLVHSFSNSPDGNYPLSGLTKAGSTFFGATDYGGANGVGAIFSIP